MMIALLTFLTALGVSVVLTPIVRGLAHLGGYLDHPDGRRKLHSLPVPRIGGVAIYLAFAAAFGTHVALDPSTAPQDIGSVYLHLVLACGAVMLIGLVDDIRGVSPLAKVLVQAAAGTYLYACGFQIEQVSSPFGPPLPLGALSLPLTVLWFVGMSNAFNLIDGLDGLAAGVAFFATGSLFVAAVLNEQWGGAALTAALAGALLGFLRYNFSPASIFLGDSGSLFVGFALAAFAIWNSAKASAALAVAAPLLALALPILDVLISVLRRLVNGHRIFEADGDHIHHRLLQMGFTRRRAVFILYSLSVAFGSLSLVTMSGFRQLVALALAVGALLTWAVIRRLGYVEISELQRMLARKLLRERRTVANNTQLRRLKERLARAQTLAELWDTLVETAASLDFQQVEIRVCAHVQQSLSHALSARKPAKVFPVWSEERLVGPAPRPWSWSILLVADAKTLGELVLSHTGTEAGLHFDPSYLLSAISSEFATGLHRILCQAGAAEPASGGRDQLLLFSLARAQE